METLKASLYDYPVYYDLVFGSDWKAELDFLLRAFGTLAERPIQRVFEPACGTGRLMFRLAQQGLDVCGLDLNRRAVKYCNRRLQRHGFPASARCGDMTRFQLAEPVDAAFNMINSFRHLTRRGAPEAHLRSMAEAIRPGGLYVLGLHLTPTLLPPTDGESWSARRGHLCVTTDLQMIDRDLRRRREICRMVCRVYKPTQQLQLEDELVFRTYTAVQIRQLIHRVDAFELTGIYDFRYRLEDPVELGPEIEDAVFVLRRR